MEFFDPNTHKPKNPEDPKLNKDFFAMTEESLNALKNKVSSIDESKLSPEQKTIFQSAKDSIKNLTRKVVKTVGWVTFIAGTFTAVNYERTHSDLEITTNQDGTHEYKHEDERTNHLLNVLAGREKITEEDLRIDYDSGLEYTFKEKEIKLKKSIKEMSLDEIDQVLFENADKLGFNQRKNPYKLGDFKKEFELELKIINMFDSTKFITNKNIYDLVWKLEEECGNPKIRVQSENISFTPLSDFKGNKHFDFLNNIIYISYWDIAGGPSDHVSVNGFVSELAHAKQYKDNPVALEVGFISDMIKVIKKSNFNINRIANEYRELYKTPGSVEHEAHSVIEPYLKAKYPLFIKKDNKEKKDE